MFRFRPGLLLAILSVLPPAVRGQTAYEGFDYTTGATISGSTGGFGWGGGWTATRPVTGVAYIGTGTVAEDSLQYADVASTGGRAWLAASANPADGQPGDVQLYRALDQARGADGTTTWLSFMGQRTDDPVSPRYFNFSLIRDSDSSPNEGLIFGAVSLSPNFWGMTVVPGEDASEAVNQVSDLSILDQAFVLARIDHASGDDTVQMWINPDLSLGEAGLGAATLTGSGNFGFDAIKIGAGRAQNESMGPAMGYFDEIRISDTFSGAFSPVPEPSTYALILGLGCAGAAAWRRRRRA